MRRFSAAFLGARLLSAGTHALMRTLGGVRMLAQGCFLQFIGRRLTVVSSEATFTLMKTSESVRLSADIHQYLWATERRSSRLRYS